MSHDAELLRRYAEEHSEAAFAEFVQRHAGLVYSSALRRLGGDAHATSDVVQKVFVSVARNVRWLTQSSCRNSIEATELVGIGMDKRNKVGNISIHFLPTCLEPLCK
jgi:hypothetical protein